MRIELVLDRRIDRPAVDADSNRAVVGRCGLDNELDFILPSLGLLMVIKMPWVVPNLVDMRSDLRHEPIIFLQVDRKVRLGLLSDLGQGDRILVAVDRYTHDVGTGSLQVVYQTDRRWNIGRMGRSHALDRDRVPRSDRDRADADTSCGISLDLHKFS